MSRVAAPDAATLLRWYDRHRRTMPWRAVQGESPDPYHVWLSEIMLQQTTVAAVVPYFHRFLTRFPTVQALAEAPAEAVMEAWAGLGYYARARNLHACSRAVVAAGGFPRDLAGLRALPGVGEYTAAAIGSIAFAIPVVPIDGNVERVVARIFAIDEPLPGGKRAIASATTRLGADLHAQGRPADFTQALFDLGATVCVPRNPACILCPWHHACQAHAQGAPARFPIKSPRKQRPIRYGAHFWLQDDGGQVLLRRRPPSGLLGGMLELPGTPWRPDPWQPPEAIGLAPQTGAWRAVGRASHGFTHFEVQLDVYALRVPRIDADGVLHSMSSLAAAALPRVMSRCVDAVLADSVLINSTASPRVKTKRT